MAEYREHDIEKVSGQPLVHDPTFVSPSTDDDGATGFLMAVHCTTTPSDGDTAVYVASNTRFELQAAGTPGSSMAPTFVGTGTTFTIPDNKQVLYFMTITVDGTITIGDNSYLILVG